MEGSLVVRLAAPLSLFVMMVVVGLELTVDDFRRVAAYPRAVLVGTVAQLTLLPLASFALLSLLDPDPVLAAGLVLIVAAPGGGISNVFCYLAGAHTALSVSLTAVGSLLAVVTLPVIARLGIDWFGGSDAAVEVPVVVLVGQLVALVLFPIGLGMVVRRRRPGFTDRWAPLLRRVTLVALGFLLVFAAGSDDSGLAGHVLLGLGAAVVWTAMAMALGFATARLAGLDERDAFTFLIEFGVKNVGLAAVVAIASLDRPELAVFSGAYVVTGYPLAALLCWGYRRLAAGARAPA